MYDHSMSIRRWKLILMTDGGNNSDRTEIYQAASELLENYANSQLKEFQDFNNRALDVIRLNQVIIGVIVGAYALFQELSVNIYLYATLLSFLLSLWFCIQVYSPVSANKGITPDDTYLDKNNPDLESFYKDLLGTYHEFTYGSDDVKGNLDVLDKKSRMFRLGLWSSFSGTVFFVVSLLRSLIGPPTEIIQLPLITLIDIITIIIVVGISVFGWYIVRRRNK